MNWSSWVRSFFKSAGNKHSQSTRRARVVLEQLEERLVPYSVSGGAWPNPQLITISFVPDGTQLSTTSGSTITSNLFSAFDGKFGSPAAWENIILKAAQVWAQQTNINFTVVPDNGAPSGSGSNEQGDPGFGDIRVGGYKFGNSTLANTCYPPQVNNYSIAGDVAFNTGQVFNIGTTYDLFTVATHEIGHALGLGESSASTSSVMYPNYTGIKSALTTDDIAGIRNIYSNNNPRTPDSIGQTTSAATNISSLINSTTLTALDSNLNLASTSQTDWFTFSAPSGTAKTMTVQVQSQGLSLLTPKVTVYASNGTTVLGSASGLNKYGTTLDVNVSGVTAGEKFYVKVQGADTTAFSTGAYALALNFGSGTTPVAASPTVAVADGNPLTGGGGVADDRAPGDTYLDSVPVITGITPDNGTSSADNITNTPNISLIGSAPAGNIVQVYEQTSNGLQYLGATQVNNQNQWSWSYTGAPLTSGDYTFYAAAVDSYSGIQSNLSSPGQVIINTSAPSAPTVSVNDPASGTPLVFSSVTTPVVAGTAGANDAISVSVDGELVAPAGQSWSTMADSQGNWSFTLPSALSSGVHTVTATAMTVAGTTGPESTPDTFLVTTSAVNAPIILGIAPASGSSGNGYSSSANTNAISIGGLADAGATVNLYQSSSGSPPTLLGSVVADSTGHWLDNASSAALSAGTYSFTANELTAAGTSPTSAAFSATIEPAMPTTLVSTGPALTGSGIPAPARPVITALSPAYSGYATGLTTAPSAGSLDACFTNSPTPTISGTAPAGSSVELFNNTSYVGSTTANSSGNWSFTTPHLPDNIYNFTAVTIAANGVASVSSNPIRFIVSTVPPNPPTLQIAQSATNSQQIILSGMADPGTTVNIYLGGSQGTLVGKATVNSSGSWSFAYTARPQLLGLLGVYSFAVTETNLAGNTSQASQELAISLNLLILHLTLGL